MIECRWFSSYYGAVHSKAREPALYRLWLNIRNRCNNPRTPDYRYYGGRGIKVCARWDRFDTFAHDVGPHPSGGLTFDRINTNRDYEPGNVRWATRQTQARNRNYCTLTLVDAEIIRRLYGNGRGRWKRVGKVTQAELAKRYGVNQAHISQVIRGVSWQ